MISVFPFFVKHKKAAASAAAFPLALAEGLAVGTLVLGGIGFMGTHQDTVQRAVVLIVAVISAGLNGAFDALVCIVVHKNSLLLFRFRHSMAHFPRVILSNASNLAFVFGLW